VAITPLFHTPSVVTRGSCATSWPEGLRTTCPSPRLSGIGFPKRGCLRPFSAMAQLIASMSCVPSSPQAATRVRPDRVARAAGTGFAAGG
jgi:hypothetical protein